MFTSEYFLGTSIGLGEISLSKSDDKQDSKTKRKEEVSIIFLELNLFLISV